MGDFKCVLIYSELLSLDTDRTTGLPFASPKGGTMADLGKPQNTIAVLQKYHFNFQKKFGQNFLIDPRVLEKIIGAAGITREDFVLEIGPGIGTMTQYLCENAREVTAVEIDRNLIPILEETLHDYENVEVINEDILKVDINGLAQKKNGGNPIKVVANLPYYITTPIIMGLFESHVPVDSITIMVQKEVAERMQAGPGSKDYGALSLAVQYYAKPDCSKVKASPRIPGFSPSFSNAPAICSFEAEISGELFNPFTRVLRLWLKDARMIFYYILLEAF